MRLLGYSYRCNGRKHKFCSEFSKPDIYNTIRQKIDLSRSGWHP